MIKEVLCVCVCMHADVLQTWLVRK